MNEYTLLVSLYDPSSDSHGRTDRWATPLPVVVTGWAPTGNEQPIEWDRRPVITDREVYPAAPAGGPRARWEFPDGTFEQIGHVADYSTGPWWTDSSDGAALVVYLKRVEG